MIAHRVAASTAVSALAFAAAGAASRYELRQTETRYQIAAFVAAAACVEVAVAITRLVRPSLFRGVANALAATLVIVAVKFHLEPVARVQDAAVVRHVAKKVAREVRAPR